MATVTYANGRTRKVKNLGWLLRNWRTVERIALHPHKEKNGQYQGDSDLFAYMKDGSIYSCVWADIQFAYRWINRPVLRGLPMTLYVNGSAYHQIIGEKNLDAIAKKLL